MAARTFVFVLLLIYLLAAAVSGAVPACDPSKDYVYTVSPSCTADDRRQILWYKRIDCAEPADRPLPAPSTSPNATLPCAFSCPSGTMLNTRTLKCDQCGPGYTSYASDVRLDYYDWSAVVYSKATEQPLAQLALQQQSFSTRCYTALDGPEATTSHCHPFYLSGGEESYVIHSGDNSDAAEAYTSTLRWEGQILATATSPSIDFAWKISPIPSSSFLNGYTVSPHLEVFVDENLVFTSSFQGDGYLMTDGYMRTTLTTDQGVVLQPGKHRIEWRFVFPGQNPVSTEAGGDGVSYDPATKLLLRYVHIYGVSRPTVEALIEQCRSCSPGWTSDPISNGVCYPCTPGTSSSAATGFKCVPCAADQYAPAFGSVKCEQRPTCSEARGDIIAAFTRCSADGKRQLVYKYAYLDASKRQCLDVTLPATVSDLPCSPMKQKIADSTQGPVCRSGEMWDASAGQCKSVATQGGAYISSTLRYDDLSYYPDISSIKAIDSESSDGFSVVHYRDGASFLQSNSERRASSLSFDVLLSSLASKSTPYNFYFTYALQTGQTTSDQAPRLFVYVDGEPAVNMLLTGPAVSDKITVPISSPKTSSNERLITIVHEGSGQLRISNVTITGISSKTPQSLPDRLLTCPPGSACPSITYIITCPPGTYTSRGHVSCIQCPINYFTETPGSSDCVQCPALTSTKGKAGQSRCEHDLCSKGIPNVISAEVFNFYALTGPDTQKPYVYGPFSRANKPTGTSSAAPAYKLYLSLCQPFNFTQVCPGRPILQSQASVLTHSCMDVNNGQQRYAIDMGHILSSVQALPDDRQGLRLTYATNQYNLGSNSTEIILDQCRNGIRYTVVDMVCDPTAGLGTPVPNPLYNPASSVEYLCSSRYTWATAYACQVCTVDKYATKSAGKLDRTCNEAGVRRKSPPNLFQWNFGKIDSAKCRVDMAVSRLPSDEPSPSDLEQCVPCTDADLATMEVGECDATTGKRTVKYAWKDQDARTCSSKSEMQKVTTALANKAIDLPNGGNPTVVDCEEAIAYGPSTILILAGASALGIASIALILVSSCVVVLYRRNKALYAQYHQLSLGYMKGHGSSRKGGARRISEEEEMQDTRLDGFELDDDDDEVSDDEDDDLKLLESGSAGFV